MSHTIVRIAMLWALTGAVWAASPQLTLKGGNDALRDNIRAYLDVQSQSCRLSRWQVRSLGADLARQIDEAARAVGYYHLSAERSFSREGDCWQLTLQLDPGERVTLSNVSVSLHGEGEANDRLNKAVATKKPREGDPLDHGRYESYKNNLLLAANTQGFFDAAFSKAEVLVSREDNSARMSLQLDTGPRFDIGPINVSHDILNRDLIDRYITLEEGQDYRAEQLVQLKSELQSSNYFSTVAVEPQLSQLEGQRVPVNVQLKGGPRHSYSVGAGFASDTGPRVLLGYENRYVNGAGHSFDAKINASKVITTYQVGYSIPMSRPAYDKLRLYTGYSQEDVNRSVSNRLATGVNYSTWSNSRWRNNFGLSYEEEDYSFGEDPARHSELLVPVISSSYTSSPDTQYPTSGYSATVRVKAASENLVSSTDFAQVYARLKWIWGIGPGRLLLRGEAGLTEVDDFDKLPISHRFFAGGDASVRGYDYKTLGPENDDDIVIGGSRLLTGSVEYDYRFWRNFSAAVFYDEGTAFNKGYLEPYRGVGAGLRWISPVGPVRVDLARALDGGKGWRLHLSVGPDL